MKYEVWNMKNEIWNMKYEKWKMKNEKRKTKNEKWKMKNEKWKTKNEKWNMKNEKWNSQVHGFSWINTACSLVNSSTVANIWKNENSRYVDITKENIHIILDANYSDFQSIPWNTSSLIAVLWPGFQKEGKKKKKKNVSQVNDKKVQIQI